MESQQARTVRLDETNENPCRFKVMRTDQCFLNVFSDLNDGAIKKFVGFLKPPGKHRPTGAAKNGTRCGLGSGGHGRRLTSHLASSVSGELEQLSHRPVFAFSCPRLAALRQPSDVTAAAERRHAER
jgi:hypothetical protein